MKTVLHAVLAVSSISFASMLYASDSKLKICANILIPESIEITEKDKGAPVARDHTVEEREFIELVAEDPAKNLVLQHPYMVMNSAQRLLAPIYKMGEEQIANPNGPTGKIRFFNFFEKGGEETGSMIVGQYDAKQRFVQYLEKQANGDKSGRSLLIFMGPAGTGKSEFLDMAANGFRYFTKNSPEHYIYTPVFFNLRQIPELRRFVDLDDEGYEPEVPLSYPESPVALLPESYQNMLVKKAEPKIKEMSRSKAHVKFALGRKSSGIRDAILKAYAHKMGRDLTDPEKVSVLNKHVKLRRLVLGEDGTAPKIDAKKGDINWRGMFLGENPIHLADLDPNNPFRFTEDGKVLKGNGSIVFLDEYLRNKPDLMEAFLSLVESRRVSFEFGPAVALDTVLVGASNRESYAKVSGEAGTKAQLDRLTLVEMPWSLYPHENAQIALLMNRPSLYMRSLANLNEAKADEADSSMNDIVPADLHALFPRRIYGVPVQGSDRRYALFFGEGENRVHVAPHALMVLAYTAAASHMSTNMKEAMEKFPGVSVVQEPVFRDVVSRLRLMTHEKEVIDAEWEELTRLNTLLGEGQFGISMRDAGNRWLTAAINLAREPGNENTLTPLVIKKAFEQELDNGNIKAPSDKMRQEWLRLADYITVQLIIPAIRKDIMRAYSATEGVNSKVYEQVVKELTELEKNPSQTMSDILRHIKEVYEDVNHEPLSTMLIYEYERRNRKAREERGEKGPDLPHQGLVDAIDEYFARVQSTKVSMEMLANVVDSESGDFKAMGMMGNFIHKMKQLGYTSKRSIQEALQLVLDADRKKRQVFGDQQ